MAKTPLNGSLKYVIGVIGLLITVASVYTSVVLAVGGVANKAEQNAKDISIHYKEGCKPSISVRQQIVGITKDIENNTTDIAKMDEKLDKILAILMNQPEP